MCRSGAAHQTHVFSPSKTCDDSHAEQAAQHEPNLQQLSTDLNLNQVLSVFLFDWDDTLFPTTSLTSLGPEHLSEALNAIDAIVADLLAAALATPRSHVVILTNARSSWVHHSVQSFLPKVDALFRARYDNFSLISAHQERSQLPEVGSAAYDEAIRRSKSDAVQPLAAALQELLGEMQVQSLQVISVGDQPHDLAAAHALRSLMWVEESFVKTVLMKPKPTGTELTRQLGTLCRSLPKLIGSARSFHQAMQQAQTPPSSPTKGPAMPPPCTEEVPVQGFLSRVPTPSKNALVCPDTQIKVTQRPRQHVARQRRTCA